MLRQGPSSPLPWSWKNSSETSTKSNGALLSPGDFPIAPLPYYNGKKGVSWNVKGHLNFSILFYLLFDICRGSEIRICADAKIPPVFYYCCIGHSGTNIYKDYNCSMHRIFFPGWHEHVCSLSTAGCQWIHSQVVRLVRRCLPNKSWRGTVSSYFKNLAVYANFP